MLRTPRAFMLAAGAAAIVLWVPQAAAQGHAAPRSDRPATTASAGHAWTPLSLIWVRRAVASARSHLTTHGVTHKITLGNFKICPKLPLGFARDQFSCFITHITGGQLLIGSTNQHINRNITISYAEGTDPSGMTALIPGITRSSPMPVLGGIFEDPLVNHLTKKDPNLRLAVQPVGVGIDIDPSGMSVAFIKQKIRAVNPVFGKHCFVGNNQRPIVLAPTFGTTNPPPPNQPISGHVDSVSQVGHELVIVGTVVDNAFAAPGAHTCGPEHSLNRIVDKVGSVPSPAGTNTAVFQVTVEIIGYNHI
jgi:hypothetical protein